MGEAGDLSLQPGSNLAICREKAVHRTAWTAERRPSG